MAFNPPAEAPTRTRLTRDSAMRPLGAPHSPVRPSSTPATTTQPVGHSTRLELGDESTLRVLRVLHRRGHVLGLVDSVAPGGDPVRLVLTSYGPIATHSVWHEGGLDGGEITRLATEAHDNARTASSLLATVALDVPVMPVVVVWGPDEGTVPSGGRVRHDVMFLRGSELRPWLRTYLCRGDAFTGEDARSLMVRLHAHRSTPR